MRNNTKKYILTGLMTALVFILTFIVKIPIPYTSGYIHLGDSMIYISVIVLGPVLGAFASGIGSMLADIVGGYAYYAIPTLVIKSLMALIMGLVYTGKTRKSSLISIISAISVWIVFCTGGIIYLNNQLNSMGQENLVKLIIGTDTTSDEIAKTVSTLGNLPLYLVLGIGILVIILSILAYLITKRKENKVFTIRAIIGMVSAGICMVMGYFIVESFMYSPIAALFSVPPNMVQFFGGIVAATLFTPALRAVMPELKDFT